MIAETYWQLLGDLPHWLFELTVEAVTFALGAVWAWARVKRHIHRDIADLHDEVFGPVQIIDGQEIPAPLVPQGDLFAQAQAYHRQKEEQDGCE